MKSLIKHANTYSAWKLNEYIFVLHGDAVTLEIPDAWKKLIGYEADEIENNISGLLLVLESSNRDLLAGEFAAIAAGEYAYSNREISIKCRDGNIKWFSVNSAIANTGKQDKQIQVFLVLTNITITKLEEQKKITAAMVVGK